MNQILPEEEILAGPENNVDCFVHPSSIQTRYSKVYDKSNGDDPNKTYYKLTSGNFEYRELYDYEITDGPYLQKIRSHEKIKIFGDDTWKCLQIEDLFSEFN